MTIAFSKSHRAGNDFILIDDRALQFPSHRTDLIASMCHRTTGIGADGLILWQLSSKADHRMRIFNADGSEASMCGNGILCLIDFIRRDQVISSTCTIETGHAVLTGHVEKDLLGIDLGEPLPVKTSFIQNLPVHTTHTGVPHGVIFTEDLCSDECMKIAPVIRSHPHFSPHGINVNFVQILKRNEFAMRTYERGVERETGSCGTGMAAAVFVAHQLHPGQIDSIVHIAQSQVRIAPRLLSLWGTVSRVFDGQCYTQMNSKIGNLAKPAPQIRGSEAASKQLNLNKLGDADGLKFVDVRRSQKPIFEFICV